jgi:hypothetical protein
MSIYLKVRFGTESNNVLEGIINYYITLTIWVTLPEWLTGSPAIQLKRLCFARECSNRSGDDFFFAAVVNKYHFDMHQVTDTTKEQTERIHFFTHIRRKATRSDS